MVCISFNWSHRAYLQAHCDLKYIGISLFRSVVALVVTIYIKELRLWAELGGKRFPTLCTRYLSIVQMGLGFIQINGLLLMNNSHKFKVNVYH